MTFTGIMIPLELVTVVVLGLVAALGWLAKRYDEAIERSTKLRTDRRETAIVLREERRKYNPDLEPLSFDDSSAVFDVEHEKDLEDARSRSERPSKMSPRQERRVRRYAAGDPGEPSTPPDPIQALRKKMPSRRDE